MDRTVVRWPFKATPPIVGRRDLRVDFLRGFAVLAMVVDHVGDVSPLYVLTGGNRFFVSAAEGFVFLSGLLVGIVYGGDMRRSGWRPAAWRAVLRAFTLFALSVWLTLAFAVFSAALDLPWAPGQEGVTIGQFVVEVVTFRRAYYLVDVMQLYTLALLATPLALWLLQRGKWLWLVGTSGALSGAYQVSGGRLQIPWHIEDNIVFNFAAWQVLFFTAMTIGYHRDAIGKATGRIARLRKLPLPGGWLGPLAIAIGVLIWLHSTDGAILATAGLVDEPGSMLDAWFNKAALPPLRLGAALIVFSFGWSLVSRGWPVLQPLLSWLLLPLGSKALYAYASHLFIAGVLRLPKAVLGVTALTTPGPDEPTGMHLGLPGQASLALQLIALVAVWLIVRWDLPPRLVSWLGAPPVRARAIAMPGVVASTSFPQRASRLRPTASLAMMVAAGLFGTTTLVSAWPGSEPPGSIDTPYVVADRQLSQRPRVEVTVTAKRLADLGPKPAETLRAAAAAEQPAAVEPAGPSTTTEPPLSLPLGPIGGVVPVGTPVARTEPRSVSPSVLEDRSLWSASLGRDIPYGIYLPPGYADDPSRRYPVVYLLHGGPSNYSEWPQIGIGTVADELIASGQVQPFLMVFPEGEGSYYFNHPDGPKWGDYIARDIVAHVDATERTLPRRTSRAIAGLSMGGHAALQLGFNYPRVFGVVAAHSPALRPYEDGYAFFGTPEYYEQYDPMKLAEIAERRPRALWVDTGDDDPWLDRVELLHEIFHRRGWRHRLRIFPGRHETFYWVDHAADYVRFYASSLVGSDEPGPPSPSATPGGRRDPAGGRTPSPK